MNKSKTLLSVAALGSFIAAASVLTTTPALAASKEKCAGIVKAGKNDCQTSRHGCAGQAKTSNDPEEWMYVKTGKCVEMGGKVIS